MEPKPVANLREYSNYLTPQLGLLSGDTWSAAAIILRNLILNWLVIVPLLVLGVVIPQLFLLVVKGTGLAPPWKPFSSRTTTRSRRSRLYSGSSCNQRPFQLGLRFSAKAFGPSTVSSLRAMATKAG